MDKEVEFVSYIERVQFGALGRGGETALRLNVTNGCLASFHHLFGEEMLAFVKESGLENVRDMAGMACLMRGEGNHISSLNNPVRILSTKDLVDRLAEQEDRHHG